MRKILTLFYIFLLFTIPVFSYTGDTVDLAKMTPGELLEFYKKNPDYWKVKPGLNYEEYIKWDYIVIRGEYYNKNGSPIKNIPINFILWDQQYLYTTSDKWIFNLEEKKENIEPWKKYKFQAIIEDHKIEATFLWKALLDRSIIHYKIIKKDNSIILEGIHNNVFKQENIKKIEKIKEKPSYIGLQNLHIIALTILISFGVWFYFTKNKIRNKNKKVEKTFIIPK